MKQYTTFMAVGASVLVLILLGVLLMQKDTAEDTTNSTNKTVNTTTPPAEPVDDNDSSEQSVTVENGDVDQTVTVEE